jgi:hypothetical protein
MVQNQNCEIQSMAPETHSSLCGYQKKQKKHGLVSLNRFNVEQDSGLSMNDFESFYGKLHDMRAFFSG